MCGGDGPRRRLSRDFEPGQSGHLHVQKHDVRLEIVEQPERGDAVVGLPDDFHVIGLRQQVAQLLPRRLLVVHHQGADLHVTRSAAPGAAGPGISRRTCVP